MAFPPLPQYAELDADVQARYPLTLITPATHRTINSIFGERGDVPASIALHPSDAEVRGIDDGDRVRVWNDQAELVVAARVDADGRPGVAVMAKGLWCRDVAGGLTANALVPDTLSDLAGGACFNDTRVEVAGFT
jgi:anaerobic selenocysteine-containing dehydrogenase